MTMNKYERANDESLRAQLAERDRQIEALDALLVEMRKALTQCEFARHDEDCSDWQVGGDECECAAGPNLLLSSDAITAANHRVEQRIEAAKREAREGELHEVAELMRQAHNGKLVALTYIASQLDERADQIRNGEKP